MMSDNYMIGKHGDSAGDDALGYCYEYYSLEPLTLAGRPSTVKDGTQNRVHMQAL